MREFFHEVKNSRFVRSILFDSAVIAIVVSMITLLHLFIVFVANMLPTNNISQSLTHFTEIVVSANSAIAVLALCIISTINLYRLVRFEIIKPPCEEPNCPYQAKQESNL